MPLRKPSMWPASITMSLSAAVNKWYASGCDHGCSSFWCNVMTRRSWVRT